MACGQQGENIYSDIDISDYNEPKDYGEGEINETLDVIEDTITSEDLDNQNTHQWEDKQYYGKSEDENQDMEEILPP